VSEISSKFRDWACSLSGCDGGDPNARIWLSGIEWGYAKDSSQSESDYEEAVSKYYREELPAEIENGKYTPCESYIWEDHLTYRFGQSAAKLVTAINGGDVEDYQQVSSLGRNASLFKLNLYPIAFRYVNDELWKKYRIDEITGLESKEIYRAWCFLNRFPAIASIVEKHSPKLIIGTGITYLVDFLSCFSGKGGSGDIHQEEIQASVEDARSTRRFYWSKINDGRTTLAVVPFFSGPNGLNSNYSLQEISKRIAVICDIYGGS